MTRARTLADMISDGVIGTTELADDAITPVKLDETGNYEIAGLTVSTSLLGPVAIESTHNGAYIKFRDSTSSPSNQYAWMGVAGNEIRLFVNDTEYPVAFNSGGALFNPQGGDNDFRVLSDATNYALFVDGGANSGYGRVKISSSTISTNTSTLGGDADTYINGLTIENNEASYTNGGLSLVNKYDWGYGSSIEWRNIYDTNGGTLGATNRITSQWRTGGHYSLDFFSMRSGSLVEHLSLGYNQSVFNEDSLDQDFRVESANNTHMLFVDASQDAVTINGSTVATEGVYKYPLSVRANTAADAIAVVGRVADDIGELGFYESDGTTQLGNLQARVGSMRLRMLSNGGAMLFENNDSGGNLRTRQALYGTQAVFNDEALDYDFRIESDTNTHALFVDAGNSRIGINDSSPSYTVDVLQNTNDAADGVNVQPANATQNMQYSFIGTTSSYFTEFMVDSTDSGTASYRNFKFYEGTRDNDGLLLFLGYNGTVFNEGSHDRDFRVESDSATHCFFVDANTDNIGIHTSTPSARIHIGAGANETALAVDAGRIRFRADSEKIQGESNTTGIYNYNRNDGLLIYGNSDASNGSSHYPAYHFGGYNNANQATWATHWADADPIFTMTRMTGSKTTSGSGPAKALSDSSHFTNIVKTTTKTELYDNQGQHWFHGQITTNGNIGYQYKTHEGGSNLRAFVAGDGQYIFRSATDYNHKMWYYDGVNIATNQGHGHFRVWGESNVSRSNTQGGSTLRLSVDTANGNIGVTEGGSQIYSASDERLKTSITNFPDGALTKVNALRPVTFDWKYTADEENMYGFIAQEVQAIDPELVLNVGTTTYRTDKNYGEGLEADGEITDTLAIAERKLLPVIVKAMQEMSAKIDALEAQNADLLARVTALESA